MLAGAVRAYINRYGVVPGQHAVVFANNDYAATTVAELDRAGVEVVALVDSRPEPSELISAIASAAETRLISGGVITDAIGKKHVSGAIIRTRSGEEVKLDCDLIAMSGGWNPNIQLTTHLGGKPDWNDELSTFMPGVLPPGMSVAGAAGAHSA